MSSLRPDPAAPWQESVWSYPRPPRVEPTPQVVAVDLGGCRIAETRRALRVLETSHPPVYYLPRADVAPGVLRAGRAEILGALSLPSERWGDCERDA